MENRLPVTIEAAYVQAHTDSNPAQIALSIHASVLTVTLPVTLWSHTLAAKLSPFDCYITCTER